MPVTERPEPSEFHDAVTQITYQIIGSARNAEHIAALAKASVVSGYAVRRLVQRAHLLNKPLASFSRADVTDLVMQADALDQERGLEDGIDQAMAGA